MIRSDGRRGMIAQELSCSGNQCGRRLVVLP